MYRPQVNAICPRYESDACAVCDVLLLNALRMTHFACELISEHIAVVAWSFSVLANSWSAGIRRQQCVQAAPVALSMAANSGRKKHCVVQSSNLPKEMNLYDHVGITNNQHVSLLLTYLLPSQRCRFCFVAGRGVSINQS
jgi:hypothetical protein